MIPLSRAKEPEYLKKYKVKVPWKLFTIMALVNIAIMIPCFFDTPMTSLGLTWGALWSGWIMYIFVILTTVYYVYYFKEDEYEDLESGVEG